ncbi:thiol peroxidase [Oceanirhabdus sp. W0125-5]|uniref:thiol peroxidase n=1 Tax=Oceanirhabdus sp. W0125-5 TaxID=2999116 RepID=UPI0022F2A502|nr:thiol peroxidase [Oceanirhabdus sp. W0125-5]WBW99151.1 thiol peroxidase [Oceanirhabdus sp. W0125-5]
MDRKITMGGNALTLRGEEIKIGMKAPEFHAVKRDMSPFNLNELKGKVVLISAVPSVDTKVCELQTIKFNEDAAELKDAVVLTISVDLPFAQERFCGAQGIESSMIVSDYKELDFGKKYGFVINELRLLSRGIVIIDKEGTVQYVEYVQEVTNHPDYDKAIEEAKKLL